MALYLSGKIAGPGPFELISDGSGVPVVAFTIAGDHGFTVFDLSDKLRARGWLLPAYTFPRNRQDLSVLRIVCKEGFTRDMANLLLEGLRRALQYFSAQPGHVAKKSGCHLHH